MNCLTESSIDSFSKVLTPFLNEFHFNRDYLKYKEDLNYFIKDYGNKINFSTPWIGLSIGEFKDLLMLKNKEKFSTYVKNFSYKNKCALGIVRCKFRLDLEMEWQCECQRF